MEREPGFLEWLQASVYFLPHVLFRLAAISLIFTFVGYYSIALLALVALIAFCLALPVLGRLEWMKVEEQEMQMQIEMGNGTEASWAGRWRGDGLVSLVLTLRTPVSYLSALPSNRNLMKWTIGSGQMQFNIIIKPI